MESILGVDILSEGLDKVELLSEALVAGEILHSQDVMDRGLFTELVLLSMVLRGPQLSEIELKSARGLASSVMGFTMVSLQSPLDEMMS